MKAVLISIQPKWCELIASGKKTVEIRKTKPKLETPFKVYIYCTQNTPYNPVMPMRYEKEGGNIYTGGKRYAEFLTSRVIGEFVCDKIYDITPHFDTPTFPNQYICGWEYGKEFDCLSFEELTSYLNGKNGFGWHISDLVIYDKPKELSEYGDFYVWKKCNSCRDTGYESTACCFDIDCKVPAVITRPPQSWCYVEEMSAR